MRNWILSLAVAAALIAVPLAAFDSTAEGTTFTVTDDTGTTFEFTGAAEHIVLNGTGAALTVADAGAVDKIVAVDKYSTYSYTGYEQLKDLDAVELGSFYGTSNHDYIVATLVYMVDSGDLSLDDPIILTTYTANESLKEKLMKVGFTKVLLWYTSSISSYDDIVQFVSDVSMIATGTVSDSVAAMTETVGMVESAVSSASEKAKAISVWYSSSSGVMVNNIGIASSMLEVCNAENIGYVEGGGTYYGDAATIVKLLEDNPGTVIFLSSSWAAAGKTVDDFCSEYLGGSTDFTVIQMGALWNNWCPESADGLLAMAEALYPSLFGSAEGDAGSSDEDSDGSNDALMWVVAAIVVIVIAAAAYVVFRRTHG